MFDIYILENYFVLLISLPFLVDFSTFVQRKCREFHTLSRLLVSLAELLIQHLFFSYLFDFPNIHFRFVSQSMMEGIWIIVFLEARNVRSTLAGFTSCLFFYSSTNP